MVWNQAEGNIARKTLIRATRFRLKFQVFDKIKYFTFFKQAIA